MNLVRKSRLNSFFLTLFFGPLGLLYSHVVGAIILLAVAILTAPTIIGPVLCWVVAIFLGDSATVKHNQAVEETKALLGGGGHA
jgi:hypothetical protein